MGKQRGVHVRGDERRTGEEPEAEGEDVVQDRGGDVR
jgi:hypothetical protein